MKYYKQFAEMLGLELEQEFVLTDDDGNIKDKYTYKITEDGLLYKSPTFNWAISSLGTIGKLLDGDAKAFPRPWKPKKGEMYFYSNYFHTTYCTWTDGVSDLLLWKVGNCFKTKEEAAAKVLPERSSIT